MSEGEVPETGVGLLAPGGVSAFLRKLTTSRRVRVRVRGYISPDGFEAALTSSAKIQFDQFAMRQHRQCVA